MATSGPDPARVLVVAKDDSERASLAHALEAAGMVVVPESEPYEAVARFSEDPFRLVVVSLAHLRRRDSAFPATLRKRWPSVRVLLLVPEGRRTDAVDFLEAGEGDSLLPSPCSPRELVVVAKALLKLEGIDALTGLPNRAAGTAALALEMARVDRSRGQGDRAKQSLAYMLIDLDHFGMVNKLGSLDAGDRLIVAAAQKLRAALPRSTDVLARWGGDEFFAVLADLPPDLEKARIAARRAGDRVLAAVREIPLPREAHIEGRAHVTLSGGVAFYGVGEVETQAAGGRPAKSPAQLIFDLANQREQRAKRSRDCICYSDEPPPAPPPAT